MTDERIASAAIRLADGRIIHKPPPARHPSLILAAQAQGLSLLGHMQGFLTEDGVFVTRTEAYRIALAAGQIIYDVNDPPLGVMPTPGTLYTEDLW